MRTTTIRSTGAAAVAAVLLASGAVAAGATFGARDAVAQPATPYATTTWGQVTLDSSVFGHGGDSVGQLEVSGDGPTSGTSPREPGSCSTRPQARPRPT